MEDKFFEAQYPAKSRVTEIEQLLSFIKQGNSAQIISVPGGGRSTLLGLLAYNKSVRTYHFKETAQQYHFVMVEFAEIRNKPTIDALKLIFLDIVASLEDRQLDGTYEKVLQIMKKSISMHDELVLFQGLKKTMDFLTQEKGLHVVLLLDQFDSYISMLTPDFFSQLRSLRNRAKYKFSVVFSTYKPLEDILEPSLFADFAEFIQGNTVYLHLHDEPSLSFRISVIEKSFEKTLDGKIKEQILQITAGHAKLTRLCVETMLKENKELRITNNGEIPDQVRDDRVIASNATQERGFATEILKQVQDAPSASSGLRMLLEQRHIHKALEDIWESLNPAEQTHFLKNLFPNVLDDEHSQYLKKVGLMTDESIALPLFAAFVQQKREEKPEEQTSTYTEISDKLTATEYRLLQFFLENPDIILERTAIIQGVWKETKSIAGVTDQALDQVIFRLRQKIEEDPNHPTHLVTVKGRGFRFTP